MAFDKNYHAADHGKTYNLLKILYIFKVATSRYSLYNTRINYNRKS